LFDFLVYDYQLAYSIPEPMSRRQYELNKREKRQATLPLRDRYYHEPLTSPYCLWLMRYGHGIERRYCGTRSITNCMRVRPLQLASSYG
jgi:hypothetical protein